MLKYSKVGDIMEQENIDISIEDLDDNKIFEKDNDVNLDDNTKIYLKEISMHPLLSKEEQHQLFIKYKKENDKDAYNKLVLSNLRLCVYVAKRNIKRYKSTPFLDLIQEYNLILMKAIEKYDPEKNIEFSTYAIRSMINGNSRIAAANDSSVREKYLNHPVYMKYKSLLASYKSNYNRYPTKQEVMDALNITATQYEYLLQTNINVESLNTRVKDKDNSESKELQDFIAVEKNEYKDKDTFIDEQILKKAIYDFLPPKLYYIIYYRLLSSEIKTLEEIANTYSITREGVRQLEKRSLEKIKPILQKIQKDTVKKYGIKELLEMNLTPQSPEIIVTLHYLKQNISEVSYTILHNMIVNNKQYNIEYYYKKYPFLSKKILENEMADALEIYRNIYNGEIVKRIYDQYKNKYTISQIFELDIKPSVTKDYKAILKYIEQIKYEDIENEEYIQTLNSKQKDLVKRYFNTCNDSNKSQLLYYRIERDINLLQLGYYNQKQIILTEEEVKKILAEKKEYLEAQQLNLINQIYIKKEKNKRRHNYIDNILLGLKFNIIHYFDKTLLIDQIKDVIKKDPELLNVEDKKIIFDYYGVDTDKKTITELAVENNMTYIEMHDKLRNLRTTILKNYYDLIKEKKDISKEEFLKYLSDKRYDFSSETRKILTEYLQGNDNYKDLAAKYGYSEYQISNFVTEGIRKANMYYYNIMRVLIFTEEELNNLLDKFDYDDVNRRIIKKYCLDGNLYKDIAKEEKISTSMIKYIVEGFYQKYLTDRIPVIPVSEYENEVNQKKNFSMLNETEKMILSHKYGFTNEFNKNGEIYNDKEIKRILSINKDTYLRCLKSIDMKIRERILNIKTPEYGIIAEKDLIKILKDMNLPISKNDREILCHLSEINGYKYLTCEELSKKYGISIKNFKRKYQRIILTILQYQNNKKQQQISYESDILPIENYFCDYDRKILKIIYGDKLTAGEISKKTNLTIDQTRPMILKLKITVAEILTNSKTAKKFDFNKAREVINSKDFYLGESHDTLVKIYQMVLGENGYEKHPAKEVKEKLNLNVDVTTISHIVYKVMIEIEKYKIGIRNTQIVTKDEIKKYYLENHQNMQSTLKKVFERYLTKKVKLGDISDKIPEPILYEVLKYNNKLVFSLKDKTKDNMIKLIQENKQRIPKKTIKYIKMYYGISEKELMNGKERIKLLKIFEQLYLEKHKQLKK